MNSIMVLALGKLYVPMVQQEASFISVLLLMFEVTSIKPDPSTNMDSKEA
jgi:hypothetical protein